MTPDRWREVTAIFHEALARDEAERTGYLDEACGGDAEVRGEVVRLLAAHQQAGRFGEVPLVPALAGAPPFPPVTLPDPDAPSSPDIEVADSEPEGFDPPARRSHPFRWLLRLAGLAVAAVFAYAAWLLVLTQGTTPALGWSEVREAGEWFVAGVNPAGPAAGQVLPGDRLINMNGGPPFVGGGTGPYRQGLRVGESYQLVVDRQGERLELTLPVAAGPNRLANYLAYFLFSFVWCAVGLFIGLARPELPTARLAAAAAVMTGVSFVDIIIIRSGPSLFNPLHLVVGLHFFSRFPTGRPVTGAWRWLLVSLYTAGAVPFLLNSWVRVTRLTQGRPGVAELVNAHPFLFAQLRMQLASYVFYAGLILAVLVLARNYRQLDQEAQRRRMRWVAFGSILALTPHIIISLWAVLGRSPVAPWVATGANLFTVVMPLSVAYAIVRHRVFDIRVVIRRGIHYLLARRVLQAAVVVPILALIFTLSRHRDLTLAELAGDTQAYLYWLGATALMLTFRTPLQRMLDRRFFREEFDSEQLLVGLLEDVQRVGSIPELGRVVSDRLMAALHPTSARVWYLDPDDLALASASDPQLTPPDVPSSGSFLGWLERQGTPVSLPLPAEAGLSAQEARWYRARRITLIVPMLSGADRIVGALLLGEKKSEEPYTAGDVRLLGAIARQAAVVRENVRLRERVGEELRVRHDVLARLDSSMPDLLKECPVCGGCFDGPVDRCVNDGQTLRLSLPVRRTIDARYRLDRLIGRGGMGAVYEAFDQRVERKVALKILLGRAFGDPSALRRFHREARAMARLNHPSIVAMYDYGVLEGQGAYLVLELVRGVTLREELERRKFLPPAAAADWFGPLLDGLAGAHAAGIVHRDLKPENIMGRRAEGGAPTVKILDLGLAKLRPGDVGGSLSMTAEGIIMGTPGYMSPEQRLGRDVDQRTDIYAAAVMLMEVLTGRRPDAHRPAASPPTDLQTLTVALEASAAGRKLIALLQHCLAEDPRDRYASAVLLRAELIPALRACGPLDPGPD